MNNMKRSRATHKPSGTEVYVVYILFEEEDTSRLTYDSRVMLVQDFNGQVFAVPNGDLEYHYTQEGNHLKE